MSPDWKDAPTLLNDLKEEISEYGLAARRQYERIFTCNAASEISARLHSPAIEFHFLITALWRVRKLLEVLHKSEASLGGAATIKAFDDLIPNLNEFRDTLEHYDERLKGLKKKQKIRRARMRSWGFGEDFVWLDAGVISPDGEDTHTPLERQDLCLSHVNLKKGLDLALEFVGSL